MQNSTKNLLFILLLVCFGLAGGNPDATKPGMVQVHGGTLFWSVITFLLLLIVLKKVAWAPIISGLENRETEIKEALNSAERAKKEADKVAEDYEEMIRKAQAEAQKIVAESKAAGEKVREEIKVTAEKEAGDILEKAQHQIQTEKEKAVQEIRSSIVEFSLQAATKVIEKNVDSKDNRRLIKETVAGIGKS